MATLQLVPTLDWMRRLYMLPRDAGRFHWYLDGLTTAAGAIALPVALVNPMGREHCLAAVEALIALDAESLAAEAMEDAGRRLGDALPAGEVVSVALNLIDDVAGGWTNRWLIEAELRFGSERGLRANRQRRSVIVPCWASETYTPALLRQETLAALQRYAGRERHGIGRTLRELLRYEGDAMRFAAEGAPEGCLLAPRLGASQVEAASGAIEPHLDARDFPTQFAYIFGDAAAASVGYPQEGLAERAGLAVALAGVP